MSLLPAEHLEQGLEHTHPGYVHGKDKRPRESVPRKQGLGIQAAGFGPSLPVTSLWLGVTWEAGPHFLAPGRGHACRSSPGARPSRRRLLRPLHPVLPVLRVPDAVQPGPGLRHLRLLQLRGLLPLLLLLRLRRVRRLRPALRPGLRHPGRLLRVRRLPGDLHGVLRPLLLLLTPARPGGRAAPSPGPLPPALHPPGTPARWGGVPVLLPGLPGPGGGRWGGDHPWISCQGCRTL